VFLQHKTTNRGVYERAMAARASGVDDVLLWNDEGELTESTIGNLVVQLDGARSTPPRDCGLLAGTYRAALLERGDIGERVLRKSDLARAEGLWLVNAVRGWVPLRLVD
jgi:para-aminobenzoate synthetase/4-amino-4-deoxychorismate lyase